MAQSTGTKRSSPAKIVPAHLLLPDLEVERIGRRDRLASAKHLILNLGRSSILFKRNQVIYREGDIAEYVYIVASGTVRSCRPRWFEVRRVQD